jgi:hypothetical protein
MFEEPLEDNIQEDIEKDAYLRKKRSLKRLTFFVFVVDVILAVYVITQLIAYMQTLLEN